MRVELLYPVDKKHIFDCNIFTKYAYHLVNRDFFWPVRLLRFCWHQANSKCNRITHGEKFSGWKKCGHFICSCLAQKIWNKRTKRSKKAFSLKMLKKRCHSSNIDWPFVRVVRTEKLFRVLFKYKIFMPGLWFNFERIHVWVSAACWLVDYTLQVDVVNAIECEGLTDSKRMENGEQPQGLRQLLSDKATIQIINIKI